MMKNLLALLLVMFAGSSVAQTTAGTNPESACGSRDVTYKVELSDDTTIANPASGKATLVLIEDELFARPGRGICWGLCGVGVQLGMDGQWIAAAYSFSHTTVSIDPGDHHFCVLIAPKLKGTTTSLWLGSMYGLHVEAGKTYFLRARLQIATATAPWILDLSQLNDDEGRYMVSMTKSGVSKTK